VFRNIPLGYSLNSDKIRVNSTLFAHLFEKKKTKKALKQPIFSKRGVNLCVPKTPIFGTF